MEDAIGLVIFVIIIVISVIGRIIQAATNGGEQGGGSSDRRRGGEGQYAAKPEDIRQFLEGLESPRKPQAQKPPEAPRQAPKRREPEPAPSRLAEQATDTWETDRGADQGMPSGPVEEQPTVAPIGASARQRAARRKALAARKRARASQTQRQTSARATTSVEAKKPGAGDLKSAIIWSEILGPPVSRRRRPGHRPPGTGR